VVGLEWYACCRLKHVILKDNVNLTILPADKGNAMVLLNTSDYKQKISSLLQDPAYRKLTKDPTDSIERKTTALLKKSSLTEETRRQLGPAGSRPPRLYELPKIHKEGIPLRPIVSNIDAPTYQLSKHLSGLLNQYIGKTAHHVKNSFHFIRILESLKIKRLEISWSALTWCLYSPKFQWKNHSHFLVNTLMMISWHYTNIC